jgi:pyridinium-3,5-bisthiocarboxylic acid mononucleotide nickel chelatase
LKMTLDPATGMSGDMFIAALYDASAGLAGMESARAEIVKVMSSAGGLLGQAEIRAEKTTQNGLAGTRLLVRLACNEVSVPEAQLKEMLEKIMRQFNFTAQERGFAVRALEILCRSEEHAHRAIDKHENNDHHSHHQAVGGTVHLHEAQDILVDIAGSARALGVMDINFDEIICFSPVRYGGGTIHFSHGTFTVPAPAVLEIIRAEHIPVAAGPVDRELLTPTGASLLAALNPRYRTRESVALGDDPADACGIGFGTLEFSAASGIVNGLVIRVGSE